MSMIRRPADQIKAICAQIRKNHGTISEASRVTGVSRSYFSRVLTDDLKPNSIRPDLWEKLMNGLTKSQRAAFDDMDEGETVKFPDMTNKELTEWVKKLTPSQREAMMTIIDMIP